MQGECRKPNPVLMRRTPQKPGQVTLKSSQIEPLESCMQVNILESKNHLSQLVRRAQQGEEVIIAHRGVPAVKLVPVGTVSEAEQRDVLAWIRRNPLPLALRRSAQEIDNAIALERRGWD